MRISDCHWRQRERRDPSLPIILVLCFGKFVPVIQNSRKKCLIGEIFGDESVCVRRLRWRCCNYKKKKDRRKKKRKKDKKKKEPKFREEAMCRVRNWRWEGNWVFEMITAYEASLKTCRRRLFGISSGKKSQGVVKMGETMTQEGKQVIFFFFSLN